MADHYGNPEGWSVEDLRTMHERMSHNATMMVKDQCTNWADPETSLDGDGMPVCGPCYVTVLCVAVGCCTCEDCVTPMYPDANA